MELTGVYETCLVSFQGNPSQRNLHPHKFITHLQRASLQLFHLRYISSPFSHLKNVSLNIFMYNQFLHPFSISIVHFQNVSVNLFHACWVVSQHTSHSYNEFLLQLLSFQNVSQASAHFTFTFYFLRGQTFKVSLCDVIHIYKMNYINLFTLVWPLFYATLHFIPDHNAGFGIMKIL